MLLLFSFLFLLALEGLICIAMSFPIATQFVFWGQLQEVYLHELAEVVLLSLLVPLFLWASSMFMRLNRQPSVWYQA